MTLIHTNFNSPNPSNYPHFTFHYFTFHSIQDGLSATEVSTNDVVSLLSLLNIKCAEPFKDRVRSLVSDDVSEEPVSCLITDAIFHFTQAVAESLRLPRIILRTVSSSSLAVFATFLLLREKGYLSIQDLVDNMVSATKASSGLMWNNFEDLEQSSLASLIQQFSIPMFLIAPFHKHNLVIPSPSNGLLAEDQTSIPWLKTQPPKSVVYVSFGSIAVTSEQEFLEMALGLTKSEQPFLRVVRPGLVHGAEWLEPLPSGLLESLSGHGRIVKWAPQQEVLARKAVGAFWTHNGWNSTLVSVCEGVPRICMPCFGDQKVNARFVSQVWKVGLPLENGKLERGEIEKVIRRLMRERDGDEIRGSVLRVTSRGP